MPTVTTTLTGDDVIMQTIGRYISSPDGYYVAQKEEENVLVQVKDGNVLELGITTRELESEGYRLVPMVVMPVSHHKELLALEFEKGFQRGADSVAIRSRK